MSREDAPNLRSVKVEKTCSNCIHNALYTSLYCKKYEWREYFDSPELWVCDAWGEEK
jgi:hypothetical protein